MGKHGRAMPHEQLMYAASDPQQIFAVLVGFVGVFPNLIKWYRYTPRTQRMEAMHEMLKDLSKYIRRWIFTPDIVRARQHYPKPDEGYYYDPKDLPGLS